MLGRDKKKRAARPPVVTRKGRPIAAIPNRTPDPVPEPMLRALETESAKQQRLQSIIAQWVEWFRGINDPAMQRRVAERQLGLLTAEKNMERYDVVFGGAQVPRIILFAPSRRALAALQWALARMWPSMKFNVIDDSKEYEDKKTACEFCGARVRVPCSVSRSNACPNRSRGNR